MLCPLVFAEWAVCRTAMLFLGKARLQAIPSLWHWWMTGSLSPRLSECVWREAGTEIKRGTGVTCDSCRLPFNFFSLSLSCFFVFWYCEHFFLNPVSPTLCLDFAFWQVLYRSRQELQSQQSQSQWVHVCFSSGQHFLHIRLRGTWLSWTHTHTHITH